MQTFGQQHVDLLRLDIEGAEYDVLELLPEMRLRPTQLVIDFHHHIPPNHIAQTERALALLHSLGYRIYARGPSGRSYSLVLM
jgi:EAL domain-containing protein (putative c-di-GMP-specific phosphodiesterase class I)